MEDVTPELLETLLEEYGKEIETSEIIRFILEKIKEGSATYTDANAFAIEIGSILSKAYGSKISSDVLPNGKMYYNIADRLLRGTLTKSYEDVADVTVRIQEILNEKAKIGIKAIKPEINEDRIKGLIELVSAAEHYDDVGKTLGSSIENYTQSIVDDAIKANVEFHGKSGLSPVISRKVAGNCCAWCARLVGNYSYPDVPKDVYRRHRNCRCTVDYDPGTGKRQNVHTKLWADSEQELEQRKTIGLEKLGLKGNVPNDTMKLKDKITSTNNQIEQLKEQFSELTEGYSYDEWFKDFSSIEDGYGEVPDGDDISKRLKELDQKITDTEKKKTELLYQKEKRNQLDTGYSGQVPHNEIDTFNAKALNQIKADTGYSDEKAEEFQRALQEYFGDGYETILSSNTSTAMTIRNGIDRMPVYDGSISRGMIFDNTDVKVFTNLQTGAELSKKGLIESWSSERNAAIAFSGINSYEKSSVILECMENKTAVGVQHLSLFGSVEAEVLSSSKYEVVKVTTENKYDYLSKHKEYLYSLDDLEEEEIHLKENVVCIIKVKEKS